LLGAATSKVINALIFLSFNAAFYGVASRFTTHTLAALTTFFMIITPEMLGFSSMSGSNYTHAMYASLGVLFFIAWRQKKIPSFLWISAALLMVNVWTRREGLSFSAATGVVLLCYAIQSKQYRKLLLYGALCLFPLVFWMLFLKTIDYESTQAVILKPFWDGEKVGTMLSEIWTLFKSVNYYGLTFIVFLLALISNVWHIYKKRDHVLTLALIAAAMLFYTIIVYQVDYKLWEDTLLNVMKYSYKRFLFAFVPLLWFYVAASYNVKWVFDRIDKFVFPRRGK
jgi:hypothetical protein